MSRTRTVLVLLAAALCCAGLAMTHTASRANVAPASPMTSTMPLSAVLLNLDTADESATRAIASSQAASGNTPVYSSSTANERVTFIGDFTPASADSKLAIFSDDGCDVYVNDERIHNRLSQGQHLPDLGQSFYVLSYAFTAGQTYTIRVEYSNTIFTGNWDVDGCTLFTFNGGGATGGESWNLSFGM